MDTSDFTQEEYEEYIDLLHDRIQFLEQELQKSEETVLQLQQEKSTATGIDQILQELDIDLPNREELQDLSPEDFSSFEDKMLHNPEEIFEDEEKAFEEMIHALEKRTEAKENLETIKDITDQIEENNEKWFDD